MSSFPRYPMTLGVHKGFSSPLPQLVLHCVAPPLNPVPPCHFRTNLKHSVARPGLTYCSSPFPPSPFIHSSLVLKINMSASSQSTHSENGNSQKESPVPQLERPKHRKMAKGLRSNFLDYLEKQISEKERLLELNLKKQKAAENDGDLQVT